VSKVFRSIGKVFRKVVHTALKIAPFALAAAAVVFTGGAALGLTPTFSAAVGGIAAHLGLSAAVTGALTGAVTSAGFGAALGFVTGGKKGLQKGALMGALSGGVLGAVNPSTFGIVKGPMGGVTTAHSLASAAAKGIAPQVASTGALQPTTTLPDVVKGLPGMGDIGTGTLPTLSLPNAGPVLPSNATGFAAQQGPSSAAAVEEASHGIAPLSASPAAQAPEVGNGLGSVSQYMEATTPSVEAAKGIEAIQQTAGGVGGIPAAGSTIADFLKNPTLIGSVLSAIGAGGSKVSSKDLQKQVNAEIELRRKAGELAYGGVYSKPGAFGIVPAGAAVQPRYYYDPTTKSVVDRQQGA
jgi:hypothetical protein